ncbi:uncharacterized protein N0V89_009317 [Didymosphaeria variabile]|uniref:Uncharacterized protein n=1 Tax=Didymosphaeria variabile TaxID=1932322 RepID=A0A9W8XDP8_9PLEO|nr:uncharacterized protein N0V89_009317 [Didymosphaeria variabile]KAJ4347945.1 hypothetical protein N0V89_009317 [Didymosphaeria variabile]
MQLLELPLPLVQDILRYAAALSSDAKTGLRLRLVNRFFDRHVFKYLARYNIDILTRRKRYRSSTESFKVRVAREHIGDVPSRPCSDFVAHIHDVVDDILFLTSQTLLSTTTSTQIKNVAIAGDLHVISTLLDFADHPAYRDFFWECVVVDACAAFGEHKIKEILTKKDWTKARHVWALIVRQAREHGYKEIVDRMVEGLHPVELQEAGEKAVADRVWPDVSQLYPDKVRVSGQACARFRELKAAYKMFLPVGTGENATCEDV